MKQKYYYIPATFDLEALKPLAKGLPLTGFLFVLNHLTWQEIKGKTIKTIKRYQKANGFIPVNSTILQDRIGKSYKKILEVLIHNGDITCDYQYSRVAKQSFGYKFTSRHKTNQLISIPRKLSLKEKKKIIVRDQQVKKQYLALWKDFQNGFEYDTKAARAYLDSIYKAQMAYTGKQYHALAEHLEIKFDRSYKRQTVILGKIENQDWSLKISPKNKRLYSVVTYMRKDLKKFISFKGEKMASCDIKNSQPYFVIPLLIAYNHILKSKLYKVHLLDNADVSILSNDVYGYISYNNLSKTLTGLALPPDAEKFAKLVSKGEFYEHMNDIFLSELGVSIPSRDKLKTIILMIFFSSNRWKHDVKTVFEKHFPTVADMFRVFKKAHKRDLPILMQKIEAHYVLDLVCKQIKEIYPDIPLITVHDATITTVTHAKKVGELTEFILETNIGYKPRVAIEYL